MGLLELGDIPFCHTGIDIKQKILYQQTEILANQHTVRIPVYRKNTGIP